MQTWKQRELWRCGVAALGVILVAGWARGDDELAGQASWSVPAAEQVRAELASFLETQEIDAATKARLAALWPDEGGPRQPAELLENVTATLALVNEQAKEVVDFCRAQTSIVSVPQFSILDDQQQPPFVRNNLRLLFGRWLAQHRYYDESLQQLEGLGPDDVVDPAGLLFYQGTGYHRLPDKKQCLPTIAKLLENEKQIPRRFATVAQLIQADLEPLKTDSLDEVSRLMDEVQRRLDLKRAGKRVRDQEDEVIAKLDKLIKKLEEQQQQQQSSSAANLAPKTPAQDSKPMGGLAPGNVDPKSIGTKNGWGNLPPKDRQEALQQIGKDLPAHYREVIEEYFRKLARESGGGT